MSKHKKTLEKIKKVPPPSNVKWDDLRQALEHLGYEMKTNSGSRRRFYHKGKDALILCHTPHPSPDVDKGCIADIREHLVAYGFIKRG